MMERIAKKTAYKYFGATLLALAVGMAGLLQTQARQLQQRAAAMMLKKNSNVRNYQADVLDEDITVHLEEVTLEEALKTIARQAGLKLVYSKNILPTGKRISLQKRNIKLEKAIWDVLDGTQLQFGISSHNHLVIMKSSKGIKKGEKQIQQLEAVSGTVTDGQSGETLPGVNILVKGTSTGTSTDNKGHYGLSVPSLQDTLIFSYVGYQTRQVPISGRTEINIAMQTQALSGKEMVVVGYGEQKKVNLTGSVSSVSGGDLEQRHVSTVSQALHGLSPGLTFSVGNRGFEPGASESINIRGVTSLNGGSPLVIIDGFPGNLDRLNPKDIKSVSILKDASAAAIYGARGSNGVILITTKSGRQNEELTVNYSGGVSIRSAQRLPEQPDSYTFARAMNEMGDNGGGRPYSNESIKQIIAYQNGDINYLKQFFPEKVKAGMPDRNNIKYYQSELQAGGKRFTWNADSQADYDWFDEYYGHSVNQEHNLSVSGGSDNISYYLNAGYMNQKGLLNYGTDIYARYNITGKVQADLADWWEFRYETRFYESPREFFNGKSTQTYSGIYRELVRTIPSQSKYTPYGEPYNYSNESKIPWLEDAGTDKWLETENWQILETELTPAKGWNITANFAYKFNNLKRQDRELTVNEEYVDHSLHANGETVPNSFKQYQNDTNYWSANLYTSYNLQLGGHHNLYGLLGSQLEFNKLTDLNARKEDLISQERPSLSTASGSPTANGNLGHWSTEGYFGRFTYNFKQKYLVEANARVDGTSRFQENEKWGLFPSFSLGWNIAKEKFWQPLDTYINSFKVRASWGQLGNQLITPYQDLALIPLRSGNLNWLFNYGGNRPQGYTGTPGLISPDLTWETTTTKNLGADLRFLNSRLQASLDIYEKTNDNMIGPSEPVPGVLGSSAPSSNNAALRTRGWEAALKWTDNLLGGDLSYFINFNLSDHKTIVTAYNNPSGLISGFYEGKELGEIWGYTAHDLFKSQKEVDSYLNNADMSYIYSEWNAGDLKYEDTNHDGAVNEGASSLKDHGDLSVIGNTTPRYQFGLNLGASYKAFDLSFLVVGTAKKDYMPNASDYVYWGVDRYLFLAFTNQHLDYFRDQPGDKYSGLYQGDKNINRDAYWPKMYMSQAQNHKNREASTRYLADASYIRVKNLEVGYTLKNTLGGNFPLKKLRIYLSGENLFTITNLIKGIDPVALRGAYGTGMTNAADRVITVGINATL